MRLFSKEWVLKVLEELGGEASLDALRLMSAGALPCKHKVADCYFPDVVDSLLSCIEGALEALEREGVIELRNGRVRLLTVKAKV